MISAEYRLKMSAKGATKLSASNCGVGDWSLECINNESDPPITPVLKGRAKIVTECAEIWGNVKALQLDQEDDDYLIARQRCMKLFYEDSRSAAKQMLCG